MASTFISISRIWLFFVLSLIASNFLDQLWTCAFLFISFVIYVFLYSTITKNHSQVDELWTISPIFFVYHLNNWSPRGTLVFVLVAIWGIRLSYNFWRKGGYRGYEDYRWGHLKTIITNPILWHLFNLFIISFYQLFLLVSICSPAYFVPKSALGFIDFLLAAGVLGLIAIETIADQQQWDFQLAKKNRKLDEKSMEKGFLDAGLFKYSRHPNFCAEICIWWGIYCFTYSINISIIGPILLTLLFQGSSGITEKISAQKYPSYKLYQKSTSRIIPWFPSSSKAD